MGWDHVFDSRDPEMSKQVRAATGGMGVDAVWDVVGGSAMLALSVSCVRLGGTIVVVGMPLDEEATDLRMSTMALIYGELNIVGVRGCGRRDQDLCMQLLGEGKVAPVIDSVFPLAEAAESHAYLEDHRQIGKVPLRPTL